MQSLNTRRKPLKKGSLGDKKGSHGPLRRPDTTRGFGVRQRARSRRPLTSQRLRRSKPVMDAAIAHSSTKVLSKGEVILVKTDLFPLLRGCRALCRQSSGRLPQQALAGTRRTAMAHPSTQALFFPVGGSVLVLVRLQAPFERLRVLDAEDRQAAQGDDADNIASITTVLQSLETLRAERYFDHLPSRGCPGLASPLPRSHPCSHSPRKISRWLK